MTFYSQLKKVLDLRDRLLHTDPNRSDVALSRELVCLAEGLTEIRVEDDSAGPRYYGIKPGGNVVELPPAAATRLVAGDVGEALKFARTLTKTPYRELIRAALAEMDKSSTDPADLSEHGEQSQVARYICAEAVLRTLPGEVEVPK